MALLSGRRHKHNTNPQFLGKRSGRSVDLLLFSGVLWLLLRKNNEHLFSCEMIKAWVISIATTAKKLTRSPTAAIHPMSQQSSCVTHTNQPNTNQLNKQTNKQNNNNTNTKNPNKKCQMFFWAASC